MAAKNLLQSDPLLADRTRLVIMSTLASSEEPVGFMELLEVLELTRGNLATHINKLEANKYIKVHKKFIGKKPNTTFSCTVKGKKAVKVYLEELEAFLKDNM